MPNFHHHVCYQGERTLDHCYTPFKRGYKAASLPLFDMSDHAAIFLLPEDKQRIVREDLVTWEVKQSFDRIDDDLQE